MRRMRMWPALAVLLLISAVSPARASAQSCQDLMDQMNSIFSEAASNASIANGYYQDAADAQYELDHPVVPLTQEQTDELEGRVASGQLNGSIYGGIATMLNQWGGDVLAIYNAQCT